MTERQRRQASSDHAHLGRWRAGRAVGHGSSGHALSTRPVTVAVEQARDFVHARLDEWSLPHMEEAVAAVAVELVANAVRHARTNLELRLSFRDRCVAVEVLDYDDHLPELIQTGPDVEYGRGLHIVEALTRRWGAVPVPGGKVVWAEVEARPRSPA